MLEVHDGCPFCVDNHMVDVLKWTSDDRFFLVKAHGHEQDYLVIPVSHATNIWDVQYQLLAATTELLPAIPWFYHGVSYNLSLNIGRQAGQRVEHLHLWIVYRNEDSLDGLGLATLAEQARKQS